jgi:glycosyltransferase involved in cell wall biosynthesis
VITDIAGHLADEGCSVSVIASKNLYNGGAQSRLAARERLGSIRVRRVWAPSFGRITLPGRILDQLSFMVGATCSALFAPRADTVVLLTNPPLFAALGMLLKRLRRERFVYVVMDLYPDVAVNSGHVSPKSLLTRSLRWLTRRTLRSADSIVVLGECMKRRVLEYGARPEQVEVIRNWADEEAVEPVPPELNLFRKSRGWDDTFVVMYSGNMGVAHSFDDILEVARRFRDRSDVVFVFVGDGVRRAEIESFREREELQNVTLLPYQEQSRLAFSLSAADAHLVSLREGFEGLVVPSKAYGIMAAARPIIYQGDPGGEIARMVADNEAGLLVRQGDVDALEAAVVRLMEDRPFARRLGERGRQVLVEQYSRRAALARYRVVLGVDGPG